MTIRHTPKFLIPLLLTILLSILLALTSGVVSAQQADVAEYVISFTHVTAPQPGGDPALRAMDLHVIPSRDIGNFSITVSAVN